MKTFYSDLPISSTVPQLFELSYRVVPPSDWWIVMADVVNSTDAINRGQYKQVNAIGASVITVILNLDRATEIPYAFGGDGATCLIPPQLKDRAEEALVGVKRIAIDSFELHLRAKLVCIADILAAGHSLWVGRLGVSHALSLAAFLGTGWDAAEAILKGEAEHDTASVPTPNLAGLECRWDAIPSQRGRKMSVLVQSVDPSLEAAKATYTELMDGIRQIFGSEGAYHPVDTSLLRLVWNPFRLLTEAKARATKWGGRIAWDGCRIALLSLMGKFLIRLNVRKAKGRWGGYPQEVVDRSDYLKFDGKLKVVLDGTSRQEEALRTWLESLHRQGKIFYGCHSASTALITCLVHSYSSFHVHFIDASDGGYALAAIGLKKQLKAYRLASAA